MKLFILLLVLLVCAIQVNNHPENLETAIGKIAEIGISAFEWLGDTVKH
jgi:hypothetical protein